MSVHERNLPITHLTPLTPHTFSDKDIVNNKKLYQDKYNLIKKELELFIAKLLNNQIIEPKEFSENNGIKVKCKKLSKKYKVIILTKKYRYGKNPKLKLMTDDTQFIISRVLTGPLVWGKIKLEDMPQEIRLFFSFSVHIDAARHVAHEYCYNRKYPKKFMSLIMSDYNLIKDHVILWSKEYVEDQIELIKDTAINHYKALWRDINKKQVGHNVRVN